MLDFQLWKVREDDPGNPGKTREALRYTFYEKPMSNPRVMDSSSAMPHRVKLASLTQEGVRRMCNMSQELESKDKCQVLSNYMLKLKKSGYSQATRSNILESAVNTFCRKEKAEQLGVQPVHRLGTHGQESRRRVKLAAKSSWYLPSTTGWKARLASLEGQREEAKGELENTLYKPTGELENILNKPRGELENTRNKPTNHNHLLKGELENTLNKPTKPTSGNSLLKGELGKHPQQTNR